MSVWDNPFIEGFRLVRRGSSSSGNNFEVPKITNPTNSTVWTMGSDVVVTWTTEETSDKSGTSTMNRNGTLLLGSMKAGSGDEYLDIEHPLATDFELKKGFIDFECPKVEPHNHDYFVTFLHDTRNRSPIFSIRK